MDLVSSNGWLNDQLIGFYFEYLQQEVFLEHQVCKIKLLLIFLYKKHTIPSVSVSDPDPRGYLLILVILAAGSGSSESYP